MNQIEPEFLVSVKVSFRDCIALSISTGDRMAAHRKSDQRPDDLCAV